MWLHPIEKVDLEDMMSYESFGDALYQQLVYSNNEQDQQELVR